MLKYTGHPLVDVGVATITAFTNKRDPTELTENDLNLIADYITQEYTRQPWKSFLTVAFPNSGFTQPAFEKTPERRIEYAQRVLRGYYSGTQKLDERCVFTGEPAIAVAFGDKEGLPLGRAFRQHIPLLTGEDVINFHPYGDAGLPVSGLALLAIQAFPLGCAKCGGRLLIVHSDNPEITQHFATEFLEVNRKLAQVAQLAGDTKMPNMQHTQRTLLIETLLKAKQRQAKATKADDHFSITAYHLSNSGQGPGLTIYHLPMQAINFLRDVGQAEYAPDWNAIVHRAWERERTTKKKKPDDTPFQPRRNWLYEDLFDLPANAKQFIRTYFLRIALRRVRDEFDPRVDYSVKTEVELVSWKITALFLWRIMNMDKKRVEQIRTMGDQLAEYVNSQNDRRLFREFYMTQSYNYLRVALIKANVAHVKRGNAPFITLDPFMRFLRKERK